MVPLAFRAYEQSDKTHRDAFLSHMLHSLPIIAEIIIHAMEKQRKRLRKLSIFGLFLAGFNAIPK